MLKALLSKFSSAQRALLTKSINGKLVSAADLNLADWPTLTFVLEGDAGDISLQVARTGKNAWSSNDERN